MINNKKNKIFISLTIVGSVLSFSSRAEAELKVYEKNGVWYEQECTADSCGMPKKITDPARLQQLKGQLNGQAPSQAQPQQVQPQPQMQQPQAQVQQSQFQVQSQQVQQQPPISQPQKTPPQFDWAGHQAAKQEIPSLLTRPAPQQQQFQTTPSLQQTVSPPVTSTIGASGGPNQAQSEASRLQSNQAQATSTSASRTIGYNVLNPWTGQWEWHGPDFNISEWQKSAANRQLGTNLRTQPQPPSLLQPQQQQQFTWPQQQQQFTWPQQQQQIWPQTHGQPAHQVSSRFNVCPNNLNFQREQQQWTSMRHEVFDMQRHMPQQPSSWPQAGGGGEKKTLYVCTMGRANCHYCGVLEDKLNEVQATVTPMWLYSNDPKCGSGKGFPHCSRTGGEPWAVGPSACMELLRY
jgi:hypothetical protein